MSLLELNIWDKEEIAMCKKTTTTTTYNRKDVRTKKTMVCPKFVKDTPKNLVIREGTIREKK